MTRIYDLVMPSITGTEMALSQYAGKVLLLVNVASQCGLTPQYAGLEELQRRYADRGLVILGFPCNQFAGQEPGTESEILKFCRVNYDVTFQLFAKIDVNGPDRHALYELLAGEGGAFPGDITWNFEKFLIDRTGAPVARFAPKTTPDDPALVAAIESALDQ